mmetsp:Transcript_34449/g.57873  ORF Transcript_34449/g.57873 Transcript_34449/m.57873 type:complete len:346 (-) Transcript_34449:259-1296(-)|eukprot:CAMPEP_0198209826 /NCGR_PEP_ID=MMETSP1445-20131203/17755_1 /TAXON_ID=36898 /ORGANISM="Pyramimonas sp., Strain CCMP2087" /LENGTH=345 /DNA_ID=CAMNT_0043883719 /DNA_START=126 /DNA_END=1163 /DNA_ORIENTATION=-
MADMKKAFEEKDAEAVARHALCTVGNRDECIAFFGRVLAAVAQSPDRREGLPEQQKPTLQMQQTKKQAEVAAGPKRKEPQSSGAAVTKPHDPKRPKHAQISGMDFFESDIQDNPGSLFILLPNLVMGSVIGKAGATIKGLKKRTGAKIEMDRMPSFGDFRLVTLQGSLRQVTIACHEVADLAAVEAICLLVPNSICGLIIGKQGGNIKKLEKETGANLQMEREADDMRKVLISGEPNKRSHALYLIASLISANETRTGVFDPRGVRGNNERHQVGPSRGSRQRDDDAQPAYQAPVYSANNPMHQQQQQVPNLNQQHTLLQQQMQQLQHQQQMQQYGMGGLGGNGW